MKNKIVNLEYSVAITPDYTDFKSEDLEKISEAWSLGDYRIWFEMELDLWGNPHIVISASREVAHAGVNITKHWREIRKEFEQGEIPDWLVEEALKEGAKQ